MKPFIFLSILFCVIAMPALAELTDADLDKIRLILREEISKEIKASETRLKEYIDLKIENVNSEFKRLDEQNKNIENQFGFMRLLFIGVVGIPLALLAILFAWRAFRDSGIDKQIDVMVREHQKDRERMTREFDQDRIREQRLQERMEEQFRMVRERQTSQPSQDE